MSSADSSKLSLKKKKSTPVVSVATVNKMADTVPNSADLADTIKTLLLSDKSILDKICTTMATTLASKLLEDDSTVSKIAEALTSSQDLISKLANDITPEVTNSLDSALVHDVKLAIDACEKLNKQHDKLEETIRAQDAKIDNLEQYSRRNCLLIHGIAESDDEDTTDKAIGVIADKVGVSIAKTDVDRSHRLRRRTDLNGKKPRPIVLKLVAYTKRAQIFRAKKQLKGTGLLITESLTNARMLLLRATREHPNVRNSWTTD